MYTHLTQEERYHIYELRATGKSMRQVAKELKGLLLKEGLVHMAEFCILIFVAKKT